MSRLFSSIIFALFLLFNVISLAYEGEIEPLMVPQDSSSQELPQDEIIPEEEPIPQEVAQTDEVLQEAKKPSEPIQEEVQKGYSEGEATGQAIIEQKIPEQKMVEQEAAHMAEEVEAPSIEEQEAQHAEEAELREVGAGEEPIIEE